MTFLLLVLARAAGSVALVVAGGGAHAVGHRKLQQRAGSRGWRSACSAVSVHRL